VTEQQPARRRNVGRVLAHIAVVIGILAIAAAAFVLSYRAARDIGLAAGVPAVLARLYPGILDAVFLVACAAAVTLREARWWTRGYAWLSVLVTGALIGAADVYHAMSLQLPHKTAAGIVAALPLALAVLGFSLWLSMLRHGRTGGVAAPAPGPLVQAGPGTALAIEAGPSAVGPGSGARPALPATVNEPATGAEPAAVNEPATGAEPATVNEPATGAEPAAVNEPSVTSGADPDRPSVAEAAAEPPPAAETGSDPTAPALAADDNPGPAVPAAEAEPIAEAEAEPTSAAPQPTAEPHPESAADAQREPESRPEAAQLTPAGPERLPADTAASDALTPPFGSPVATLPDSDLAEGAAGTPVGAAEPARDATQPRPSSDRAADVPVPASAAPVPTFLSTPVPESTGPLPAPVAPGPGDAPTAEATPVPGATPGPKAVSASETASETGATPQTGTTPEASAAARGKPPTAGSLPARPAELAHETAPAPDRAPVPANRVRAAASSAGPAGQDVKRRTAAPGAGGLDTSDPGTSSPDTERRTAAPRTGGLETSDPGGTSSPDTSTRFERFRSTPTPPDGLAPPMRVTRRAQENFLPNLAPALTRPGAGPAGGWPGRRFRTRMSGRLTARSR